MDLSFLYIILKRMPSPSIEPKPFEIWPRNQGNSVQNLVLSIFQAAMGKYEFLNYDKTKLKIL